jgi:hypothetical protein
MRAREPKPWAIKWEGDSDGLSTALNGPTGPQPFAPHRRNGGPDRRLPPPPVRPHPRLLAGRGCLGTAGCFIGAAMPYSHPVAVTANVLWWGVFLGCLGGSVCAVVGLWAEPTRPSPAPRRLLNANTRPVVRRGPSRFSNEHRRRF